MATSVVNIVNNALVRIGASRIISLTEDSESARVANLMYEQVRDAVLADHVWNFAKKRVELALDTTAPAFGYSNAFALPTDCLKVLLMERADMIYDVEGGKLLTDEASAKIIYLARVEDPNQFSPMFTEALSARLAAEMAIPLVDSNSLFQNMMEMYMRKLTDARSVDSQESGAQELGASTWLQSRISYAGLNTDA